jgi:hypothetical protein
MGYEISMARPLRIEYPGAVYHITSRGNGRDAIFMKDEDRTSFSAQKAYQNFVKKGILDDKSPWEELKGQVFLGSK